MTLPTPKEIAAQVAGLKGRKDFPGAHALFQGWVQQVLAERTGWPWQQTGQDVTLTQTVRTFAVVAATVHQLITGQAELGPQQTEHIAGALQRLRDAQAPLRLLIVVDPGTKRAVLEKFQGTLEGLEVWTADELTRLPITLRN